MSNQRWGFESCCFVCEPNNHHGLRIEFYHDEEARSVVAHFTLGPEFSGAPKYVHGGVVLAILDEAMAWATIALAETFAMTRTTTASFERPVKVERLHRVEAKVAAISSGSIETTAKVFDEKDRECATAQAVFVPIGPVAAADALGEQIAGPDVRYIRDS